MIVIVDLVQVAAGKVGHRLRVGFLPVGVALVVPALARVGFGDHVGPGGRRRVRRLVRVRRVGRDRRDEHQPELVGEGAARFGQVDDDFAALVVGLDPGDAAGLRFSELFGADDAGVEGRAAGVDLEDAFDRVGEVGGFDRGAVGIFEAGPEEERVGLSAVADLRHVFGQARDDLAAGIAVLRARRSAAGCRCCTSPSTLPPCRREPGPGSPGRRRRCPSASRLLCRSSHRCCRTPPVQYLRPLQVQEPLQERRISSRQYLRVGLDRPAPWNQLQHNVITAVKRI